MASFVLGLKDRHPDNIMVTKRGQVSFSQSKYNNLSFNVYQFQSSNKFNASIYYLSASKM